MERSLDGVNGWAMVITAAPNSTGEDDAGLAVRTKYYYRVRSTNSAGDSGYSNVASATTLAWSEFSTGNPPSRIETAMADIGGSKVLLFGGIDGSTLLADTWEFDESVHAWAQYATSGVIPPVRRGHMMAFAGGSKAILFGGIDGSTLLADTWEYDASTHAWAQYNIAGSVPPARYYSQMAYTGGTTMVLFGGLKLGGFHGDTWEYDAFTHTWTEYTGSPSPSARQGHAMAYAGGTKAILYGGWSGSSQADMWEYDSSTHAWTQLVVTGSMPSTRSTSMAYAGGTRVVMFGGYNTAVLGDTWVFDDSTKTWTQDVTGSGPEARDAHSLAYAGASKVLLFGGLDEDSYQLDSTWEYVAGN